MQEKYVIYLSDCESTRSDMERYNKYGYWAGIDYVHNKELFPVTDSIISERTKVYSSKKRAENALEKALNRRYAFVMSGKIVKINEKKF